MTTIRRLRVRIIRAVALTMMGLATGTLGCRPSDVLSVPPPIGSIGSTTLQNVAGAESEFLGAMAQLFQAVAGPNNLLQNSGWLTDEFRWPGGNNYYATSANIDARYTALSSSAYHISSSFYEAGDGPLQMLLTSRSSLLLSLVGLQAYEPASGQSKIGEAYALVGYAELIMAEDYCAGVPLTAVVSGGGYQYGTPLTTDSLLGTAEAHFNTALAHTGGNDTVVALASVGLGRTLLDRGQFSQAATAVTGVSTNFVYNTVGATTRGKGFINLYDDQLGGGFRCGYMQMSDREGGNGLNFVSAHDPRLVVDSTLEQLCFGGGTWYYPDKFGNPSMYVPLATGVEARLIAAEAALQGGNAGAWASDLNALRADAANTGVTFPDSVLTIPADSTTTASAAMQVDVMFRERAFWLYGTGTRLEDLRRLIRQYRRDPSTVFPTGPYLNGNDPNLPGTLPTYGPDVSFTLPTTASGNVTSNPNYRGCIAPPSTP
jgi:hypothetical protein